MLRKINIIRISLQILMVAPLAVPQLSFADWSVGVRDEHHGHGDNHHDSHRDHHEWRERQEWREHHEWREREEAQFIYYHSYPNYGIIDSYSLTPVVYTQPAQVIVTQPVTTVVTAPVNVDTQDIFSVNIPNNNGSYTQVIIRKSGNGYVGPQGEFYAEFPRVSQLRTMYVK